MHGASNEASGAVLPWLVIRQDDNGHRYRVGRYATRDEAQKVSDSLDTRGHRQLYWVEGLSGRGNTGASADSPDSGRDIVRGHASGIRRSLGQIPPLAEESTESAREEPTHGAEEHTRRRLQRARLLFEALAHILPTDARDRWCEEWMAEWADLGERPLRTRVAWLLRVTLRSGPSCAWTLRFATRPQRVQ
ncbi:hypothetical protein Scel_87480 [Streptomyces cellostaticus]|nr:hypothetical protein Scel_87480 [Streptomyces cellostaticus]